MFLCRKGLVLCRRPLMKLGISSFFMRSTTRWSTPLFCPRKVIIMKNRVYVKLFMYFCFYVMTQNSKQMNLGRVQAEKLYFYRKELNFNLRKEY